MVSTCVHFSLCMCTYNLCFIDFRIKIMQHGIQMTPYNTRTRWFTIIRLAGITLFTHRILCIAVQRTMFLQKFHSFVALDECFHGRGVDLCAFEFVRGAKIRIEQHEYNKSQATHVPADSPSSGSNLTRSSAAAFDDSRGVAIAEPASSKRICISRSHSSRSGSSYGKYMASEW